MRKVTPDCNRVQEGEGLPSAPGQLPGGKGLEVHGRDETGWLGKCRRTGLERWRSLPVRLPATAVSDVLLRGGTNWHAR